MLNVAILLAFYAFVIWTAWPPHDLSIAGARGHSFSFVEFAFISLVAACCDPWILSIPFWIALAVCLRARSSLLYLLPIPLFAIFCGVITLAFWHAGLLVPLVICLLWITWPMAEHKLSRGEIIGRTALLFMAGVQILWAGYALAYDHSHAYSPDLAAAKFLRPFVREGDKIAVTYLNETRIGAYASVGILPYFDRNIFMNQPAPFWLWSDKNPTESYFPAALRSHPKIVLVEIRQMGNGAPFPLQQPKIQLIRSEGYQLTNVFCGIRPQRLELGERTCHLIFRRSDDSPKTGESYPKGYWQGTPSADSERGKKSGL
jgi:hypothetical protein